MLLRRFLWDGLDWIFYNSLLSDSVWNVLLFIDWYLQVWGKGIKKPSASLLSQVLWCMCTYEVVQDDDWGCSSSFPVPQWKRQTNRMLCSNTDHGGQGDLSWQLLANSRLSGKITSHRGLSAPTISVGEPESQQTLWSAERFIPSPPGKVFLAVS